MEEIERRWKWGPIAVMRHELGRSLTFWRIAAWVALAGFPVVLLWDRGRKHPKSNRRHE